MRFQKGIGYPYPRRPRGPGRGDPPYRMSRAAYHARLGSLAHVERPRTYGETRRIELEIALARHRGESYRAMARRLGLRSYAYCWRVARRYRTRQIPMLPPGEQDLLAMRESLGLAPALVPAPTHDSEGIPLTEPARSAQGRIDRIVARCRGSQQSV